MKILHLIHVWIASAINRWQLARINPLAPCLPAMVLRQRELDDKARKAFR